VTDSRYQPADARGVWVYLEHQAGRLENVALELLGKGRVIADELGVPLTGLLLGDRVAHLAQDAGACGADLVLLAEHHALAPYTTAAHAAAVTSLVLEGRPEIFLLGATPDGRDLAGRLAVRLRTGLTADCTDLRLERGSGLLLGEVVGFGGGIVADIRCEHHRPQMATVRPGVFAVPAADPMRTATVRRMAVALAGPGARTEVLERVTRTTADITQADRLVVGGGGTNGDFTLLRTLADLLGAQIGVTRVAVDAGWASADQQIGQTGYATRPGLAIVCGVSGAMQFTVGIAAAETVVAINNDPEAPILDDADYAIVGDLFQVLPPLIAEIRALSRVAVAEEV